MTEKLKVGWQFYNDMHFGLFKAHPANTILVEEKLWNKYVKTRYEFDVVHRELEDIVNKTNNT